MDKETREFLEGMMNQINSKFEDLEGKIVGLEAGQKEITVKLDGVVDEVARLREDITIVKDDMKESKVDLKLVKIATVEQANEIEKLKIIK